LLLPTLRLYAYYFLHLKTSSLDILHNSFRTWLKCHLIRKTYLPHQSPLTPLSCFIFSSYHLSLLTLFVCLLSVSFH
jgi:hypothetical protein